MRVVIGATNAVGVVSNGGVAYVYDLSSATPTVPSATLNNPSPSNSDYFATAVAISGSLVAVGAYNESVGFLQAGVAYAYDLASATPTIPITTFPNPNPEAADYFGYAIGIAGTRIVVGAYFDNAGAAHSGSAYVFDLASGTPVTPVAILQNPSPAPGDRFGWAVAVDGNIAVVGAHLDDTLNTDRGAAYVFGPSDADGDGLLDSWELTYWPTTAGHSALNDFDQDGYVELLELALGLNPTLPNAGGLPAAIDEGGYLTMTLTKQPGVTYEVQSAGTLLPALPDSFSVASTSVLINNATTLKVRDNVLIGTPPSRYLRLKVTAAP